MNQPYKVDRNRVHGNGKSCQLPNNITAKELCQTLNECIRQSQSNKYTEQQLDKITKQIIQTKLSLHLLEDDLNKLEELL